MVSLTIVVSFVSLGFTVQSNPNVVSNMLYKVDDVVLKHNIYQNLKCMLNFVSQKISLWNVSNSARFFVTDPILFECFTKICDIHASKNDFSTALS